MRKQPAPGSAQHLARLGEEVISSPAGRRRLLLLLAATGAAGLTMGCRRRESAVRSAGIRFDGWGGSVQEALHNSALLPFSRKSGIPIIAARHQSLSIRTEGHGPHPSVME